MNLWEFVYMGGYAAYVWGSYGLVLVVLALNLLAPWIHSRAVRRRLRVALAIGDPTHHSGHHAGNQSK